MKSIELVVASSTGVLDQSLKLVLQPACMLQDILEHLSQNKYLKEPISNVIMMHQGNILPLYVKVGKLAEEYRSHQVKLDLEVKDPRAKPPQGNSQLPKNTAVGANLGEIPPAFTPSFTTRKRFEEGFRPSYSDWSYLSPAKMGSTKPELPRPSQERTVKKTPPSATQQLSELLQTKVTPLKKPEQKRKVLSKTMAPAKTVYNKWQTIAVREDYLAFVPRQPQKNMVLPLEREPDKLIPNLLELLKIPTPNVVQLIMECYERSVGEIDPNESQKMESILCTKKSRYLDFSPLLLVGAALKFKSKGKTKVSYSEKQTVASQFTMFHLTTGFGEGFGKGEYLYKDDEYFSFDSIRDHPGRLQDFIGKFKEDMAVRFSTTPERIIIRDIVRGSILVKFYYQAGVPDGEEIYPKSLKPHLRGRLVKEELLFSELQLSEGDLDSGGDIDFVESHSAEEQERGFFPYYQAAGWIRYGLNVGKYGTDKIWLSMEGDYGEWAVMYHGVGSPLSMVSSHHTGNVTITVKAIIDNNLKEGHRQLMKSNTTIITESHRQAYNYYGTIDDEKTDGYVGIGVYGSPLIQTAEQFTNEFKVNGEAYMLAFQCRVRPDKIRIVNGLAEYWLVQSPNFIRPYGLLITKESIVSQEQYLTLQREFRNNYQRWIDSQQGGTTAGQQ